MITTDVLAWLKNYPRVFLNSFHATGLSMPPWEYQKTSGFLIFSEGIERDQGYEMGETSNFHQPIFGQCSYFIPPKNT